MHGCIRPPLIRFVEWPTTLPMNRLLHAPHHPDVAAASEGAKSSTAAIAIAIALAPPRPGPYGPNPRGDATDRTARPLTTGD